jgi:Ner family transcriptional regulator
MPKKPPAVKDWTNEFIKFRLRTTFGSMTAMAHCYGLHPSVIRRALRVPYPKVERVIAKALGVSAPDIWPSRYNRAELTKNPRLWRRWVNVKPSTDAPQDKVSVTTVC